MRKDIENKLDEMEDIAKQMVELADELKKTNDELIQSKTLFDKLLEKRNK